MTIAGHRFAGLQDRCAACKRTRADVLSGDGIACYGVTNDAERQQIEAERDRIWQAVQEAASA